MGGKHRHHVKSPRAVKIVLGSLSGILATTVVHPFDVLKMRLQLARSPEVGHQKMITQMVQKEGFKGMYTGLSAGVMRQACFTTTRLGVYYWLYDLHKRCYGGTPSVAGKIRYGLYAGMIGALIGCPSEMVLVRMVADGSLDKTRKYGGLIDAFRKICRDEGVLGLWRGYGLTFGRAMCFSVVQIGTYSYVREKLSEKRLARGIYLHIYTSLISSFATAVATLPVDLMKTRYQALTGYQTQYAVFHEFIQQRGMLGLYTGFVPYYTRLACHTIVTFYLFSLLNKAYHKSTKEHKIRS